MPDATPAARQRIAAEIAEMIADGNDPELPFGDDGETIETDDYYNAGRIAGLRFALDADDSTDAAIQSAQATPDDDATHHADTLRYLAQIAEMPARRALLAAAAWIERQS